MNHTMCESNLIFCSRSFTTDRRLFYVNEAACGDFLQGHDGQRAQHGQNSAGTAVYPAPGWDSGLCWTQSGVSF